MRKKCMLLLLLITSLISCSISDNGSNVPSSLNEYTDNELGGLPGSLQTIEDGIFRQSLNGIYSTLSRSELTDVLITLHEIINFDPLEFSGELLSTTITPNTEFVINNGVIDLPVEDDRIVVLIFQFEANLGNGDAQFRVFTSLGGTSSYYTRIKLKFVKQNNLYSVFMYNSNGTQTKIGYQKY